MESGATVHREAVASVSPPFVCVAPGLFLGSARAAAGPELLASAGVTLCVNVSRQQPGPRAPGVAHLRVPVFDDPAEDLLAHLEPTCAAMEAAVRAGGACLVYCKNGRSRSATVCTAYLMRHRGLRLAPAFQVGGPPGGRDFRRANLPGRTVGGVRASLVGGALHWGGSFRQRNQCFVAGLPGRAGPRLGRVFLEGGAYVWGGSSYHLSQLLGEDLPGRRGLSFGVDLPGRAGPRFGAGLGRGGAVGRGVVLA